MSNLPQQSVQILESFKPTVVTTFGAMAVGSNTLVLMEHIKGIAATVTVALGVPTALLVLIYWALKVRREWKKP